MGLSKAARNRLDEQLVLDEPEFEERLRAGARPLLSDGRCLRESELVEVLTGNGIAMDRAWLWKLSREFPSSESLAHWLLRHNGIGQDELPIHIDWVWIAVDCLWDRWCLERPRFESIERTIQEGYLTREFDIREACRMWLLVWDQVQWIYARFNFDTIDDFDECLAGAVSIPIWAQDLLALLKQGGKLDATLLIERAQLCEELVEHFGNCFGEGPSAVLLQPMRAELARARDLVPGLRGRRAA